jgi:hypothetical protein
MSLEDFDIVDIDIDVNKEETENRWKSLLDEVMEGNVIPVIGPDFQVDDQENLHTQLIRFFAKKYGVTSNPQSFAQLVYDKTFTAAVDNKRDKIYPLIYKVLSQIPSKPSELLMKLLQTKKFPFVITTSFTGVVEKAMNDVWGEGSVRVLQFTNNPIHDTRVGAGDIMNERELRQPTVFYMFGKYSIEPHRYVVTDIDMMQFCKAWMSGAGVPRLLTEIIKQKYLLFLGNNYSDWLFRFIWYSMRSSADRNQPSVFVSRHIENSLEQFLNRLETFIQTDPEKAVDEIVTRICRRANVETPKEPVFGYDVFISYSRSDSTMANHLFEALRSRGLNVWFDAGGGIREWEGWKQKIMTGIRQSRLFVPVLTKNIEAEILQEHEYRTEWLEADSISVKRGGFAFICPVAERGFDFYNENTAIPRSFSSQNAAWYGSLDDIDEIAGKLSDKVDEFKRMERELNNGN